MSDASTPNVLEFLISWGLELSARQNRVRHLIGDAHWLTDGHHKESILRDFLSRYLPQEVKCSTGFIRTAVGQRRCSPEVDILLYSMRLHPPYFAECDVSIIDPASFIANIEVKSSFNVENLKDALSKIKEIRRLVAPERTTPSDIWSGVFFFDLPESRTLESALNTLGDCLKNTFSPNDDGAYYPTCIVLGQNCIAFPIISAGEVRIKAFEGKGYAFAGAICDLLSNVNTQIGGLRLSGLDEWSTSAEYQRVERKI